MMDYVVKGGDYFPSLDMLFNTPHLLIAGATGSGKSTLINSMLYTALARYAPSEKAFIFCDPKRVELSSYKNIPHCIRYASSFEDIYKALRLMSDEMEWRYKALEGHGKLYRGTQYYIIFDEYADLLVESSRKKLFEPLIAHIAMLGRAAGIHLVLATQSPSRKTLAPTITLNICDRIALRCDSPIESKQIIGIKGAENLRPGQALYKSVNGVNDLKVPMVSEEELYERIKNCEV